jgi:hypothetical protein
MSLTNPTSTVGLQLLNIRCADDCVTTIKSGYHTTENALVIWSDEKSFTLFPILGRHHFLENTQGSLQSGPSATKSETGGKFCDGFGSNIVIQHSFGPIFTLHGRITAREYVDKLGNQVLPRIQTLLPNNDAVFQGWNCSGMV